MSEKPSKPVRANPDKAKLDKDRQWIIPPVPSSDHVSLDINVSADAQELTPEFVKQLTAVVRSVQTMGTAGSGGEEDEGRCGVLETCDVNTDRCPVLKTCGTNT